MTKSWKQFADTLHRPTQDDDVKRVGSSDSSTRKRYNSEYGTETVDIYDEEARPIRDPSIAPSGLGSRRGPTGSDGTEYTNHTMLTNLPEPKESMDHQPYLNSAQPPPPIISEPEPEPQEESSPPQNRFRFGRPRPNRPPNSFDNHRPRPSFDRSRTSMDRMRPSFEQSGEMTSAYDLMRLESSHSGVREMGSSEREPAGHRFLPRFRRSTVGSRMSRISNKSDK